MPTVFEEGIHPEGFIVSEAMGSLSREQVAIAPGDALKPGQVMGKRDDDKWDAYDPDSSEGNDTAAGFLCGHCDASSSDRRGVVIERLAEVRTNDLVWLEGVDANEKAAAEASLLVRNIKFRDGPTTISIQTT